MTEARAKEILNEVKIEESADARPRPRGDRVAPQRPAAASRSRFKVTVPPMPASR